MFDRELDYYGITSFEGITGPPPSLLAFAQPVAQAKKSLAEAQRKFDLVSLAYRCQERLCEAMTDGKTDPKEYVKVEICSNDDKFFKTMIKVHAGGEDKKLFDAYLEMLSLTVHAKIAKSNDYRGTYYAFSVKKK